MSLWTRIFNRRPTAPAKNHRPASNMNRFRPFVGELEDRSVPSAPVNDNFADAIQLTGVFATDSAITDEATAEVGEPNHAGSSGPDNSVWWKWTAPATGLVEINTFPSDFDTTLAVYTGSMLLDLSVVAENDDFMSSQSQVMFEAQEGTTYFIAVDGFTDFLGSATGKAVIAVGMTPSNDNFANATVLDGTSISVSGYNLAGSTEPGEPNPASGSPVSTVWWSWTPAASGSVVINTFGSNLDTVMGVYTGSAVNSLSLVKENDDSGGLQSQVSFNAVAGTTYHIAVGGFDFVTGAITLNLEQDAPTSPPPPPPPPANTAPSIVDQSMWVDENSAEGTLVGTVAASDADAGQSLSYAILDSGSPFVIDAGTGAISVAPGASLDFESTASYQLSVQVTDNGSPALSSTATVTVNLNDVNESPVNTVSGPVTGYEDVGVAISGLSVADPDSDSLSVTLSVAHGTLGVASVAGGAGISGNGTSSVVLTGTPGQINATLSSGVNYIGDSGFSGSDSLSMLTSDGPLSDSDAVAISILSTQQQVQSLQASVLALKADGTLSNGEANALLTKLDLKGNSGDASRVQTFIDKVNDYVSSGILTEAEAAPLLEMANNLLAGL